MGESRRVKILLGVIIVLLLILLLQRKQNKESRQENSHQIDDINNSQFLAQWTKDTQLNTVYAITPTYARPVQKAELTR